MSAREELLADATQAVTGDRNNTYGPPGQDFARTAEALSGLGFRLTYHDDDGDLVAEDLAPHHVAMILATVKLSRLVWSPEKRDSWLDLAGYAACGWECADGEEPADDEAPTVTTTRHGRFGFVPEDAT